MKKYGEAGHYYGYRSYGADSAHWCPPAKNEVTFVEKGALSPSWAEPGIDDAAFSDVTDNTTPYSPCEDE